MPTYKIRYVSGPNMKLNVTPWEEVQAESIEAALAAKSAWPVETSMHFTSAWAKNPGTSLYHVDAWEAELVG
jgi:hypothetical protein